MEIWELGNDTYFGKLSKLGKKTILTFHDKMAQNLHRLFLKQSNRKDFLGKLLV